MGRISAVGSSGLRSQTLETRLHAKDILSQVSHRLNIRALEDWYKITNQQFADAGGKRLLRIHNNSLLKLLTSVYPTYAWKPWLFYKVKTGYWDSIENQEKFMDYLSKELSIQTHDDWYKHLSFEKVNELGGRGLIQKYDNSVVKMVTSLLPQYDWKPWLFKHVPRGFWNSSENQRQYLLWLAEQFDIKNMEDWKHITYNDLAAFKRSVVDHQSILALFQSAFPEQQWSHIFGSSYVTQSSRSEGLLQKFLMYLFPNDKIYFKHKHPTMKFAKSGRSMELDAYIPALKLAIEYQGVHHYRPVHFTEEPLSTYNQRDQEKLQAAQKEGITLLQVPYWWNRSKESLLASILLTRPDLRQIITDACKHSSTPSIKAILEGDSHVLESSAIPMDPPETRARENVGLLLAQTYNSKVDPTNWWMSEKIDGIRAYWNGKSFISRHLMAMTVPQHILDQMPSVPLDGEIWFGYNRIAEAMKVTRNLKDIDWANFEYAVFDAPLAPGSFEERQSYLQRVLSRAPSFVRLIPMIQCQGRDHLAAFAQEIQAKGGEGVMLRQPNSGYTSGRSSSLLKVKSYKDDDAVVVDCGNSTFQCKIANGTLFQCEAKASVKASVRVGQVIRYHHSGFFGNGRPRRPWIIGVRDDLTLQDYLIQHHHYSLSSSHEKGKCFTCGKVLEGNTATVQVKAAMHRDPTQPGLAWASPIQMCATLECVKKATTQSSSVEVPPFRNIILVQDDSPIPDTLRNTEVALLYPSDFLSWK